MVAIFAFWLAVQVLTLVKLGDGTIPDSPEAISTALYVWNRTIADNICGDAVIQTTPISSYRHCAEFCETLPKDSRFLIVSGNAGNQVCICKHRCTEPGPKDEHSATYERTDKPKKPERKATKPPTEDSKEPCGEAASSSLEKMASSEASSAQEDASNEGSSTKDDGK